MLRIDQIGLVGEFDPGGGQVVRYVVDENNLQFFSQAGVPGDVLRIVRPYPSGRRYLACPACERPALALWPGATTAGAVTWGCRRCAQVSPTGHHEGVRQRLRRALAKVEDSPTRRPGERLDRWLRRSRRSEETRRRAEEEDARVSRSLARRLAGDLS